MQFRSLATIKARCRRKFSSRLQKTIKGKGRQARRYGRPNVWPRPEGVGNAAGAALLRPTFFYPLTKLHRLEKHERLIQFKVTVRPYRVS